jgi:malic enzyme
MQWQLVYFSLRFIGLFICMNYFARKFIFSSYSFSVLFLICFSLSLSLFSNKNTAPKTLLDAINIVQPTAIIGVSTIGGAFTKEVIQRMSVLNENPIIFALSNPTSKSECTAEEAYLHSNGKCVFASGSPFDEVKLPDGREFVPGQGNNA